MNALRILLLAPDSNPDSICGCLIGYSLCYWTNQRWFAVATGFQSGQKAKGVDLQPEQFIPSHAFRQVNLSQCGSDHRRLLANVCRILTLSREALLCPRERHQPLPSR